jgi:hypothetical protein
MRTIDALLTLIEETSARLEEVKSDIDYFELDEDDYRDSFEDFLNETGPIVIAGEPFSPATILKTLDPVAYQTELSNWVDRQEKEDDKGYKELEEQQDELESELFDLNEELENLQEEL